MKRHADADDEPSDDEAECSQPLLRASANGDIAEVERLLAAGAPAYSFSEDDGVSALMLAAGGGHGAVVEKLLASGAPWNAIDRRGRCAGNHALDAGHQLIVDQLVEAAVRAELLLSAADRVEQHRRAASATAAASEDESAEYLSRSVRYDGERLLDEANDAVMMEWERPLMEAHAARLCATGGDVLNVGFGMGIIDGLIAARAPRSHTIMEAHPAVLERIRADGWAERPGVRILGGRWQQTLPVLLAEGMQFDGIFFDTYGEHNSDMAEFHAALPRLLRPGGLYSFFNGMCPFNFFFQGVACSVVQRELRAIGLRTTFEPLAIASPDAQWEGVRRRYFQADTYYLPQAVFVGVEAAAADADDDANALALSSAANVMSIVDNGAGAAAQLIALNAPLMYWLSQSLRPGADEATRSMLREHLLPHLAAAGWALLAPLEALWAAMDADVSAARRLHGWAEPLAAGLDANSAAVVREVVRRAVDGEDDGDGDQELQLAILPNPLAGTEASAVGASGAPSGTASGAASGAVGAVGASAVANGRDGGKDSAQHMYASAREVWEERHLGTGTESSEDQWYAVSEQYWAGVRADVPGMLGGMGFVHPADVAASLALLDTLRATAEASLPQGVALDCGAGIGRVAASVLLERFEAVELVEPNGAFLAAARNVLPPARVRALHECPLQRFVPPEGSLYAAVWVQWVLIFLTDDDLVSFLSRCARALQPGGWVIVKESVAREANGFYVDRSDASITRTDRHFRRLFDAAGLRVAHAEMQPGLPRVVFPVCMYGLRPA